MLAISTAANTDCRYRSSLHQISKKRLIVNCRASLWSHSYPQSLLSNCPVKTLHPSITCHKLSTYVLCSLLQEAAPSSLLSGQASLSAAALCRVLSLRLIPPFDSSELPHLPGKFDSFKVNSVTYVVRHSEIARTPSYQTHIAF